MASVMSSPVTTWLRRSRTVHPSQGVAAERSPSARCSTYCHQHPAAVAKSRWRSSVVGRNASRSSVIPRSVPAAMRQADCAVSCRMHALLRTLRDWTAALCFHRCGATCIPSRLHRRRLATTPTLRRSTPYNLVMENALCTQARFTRGCTSCRTSAKPVWSRRSTGTAVLGGNPCLFMQQRHCPPTMTM